MAVRFIFEFIRKLIDEEQTILPVELNAREALAVPCMAYVVKSGKVVLDGRSDELPYDPAIARAYPGQTA